MDSNRINIAKSPMVAAQDCRLCDIWLVGGAKEKFIAQVSTWVGVWQIKGESWKFPGRLKGLGSFDR